MVPYYYEGPDGLLVPIDLWRVDEIYRNFNSHQDATFRYGYYFGKKLTSRMTQDEIYTVLYGSKENFLKKYPRYDGTEIMRRERIERMIEAAKNDKVRAEFENLLAKRDQELANGVPEERATCVDPIVASLVLALDGEASFDEVEWLLYNWGSSGFVYDGYLKQVIYCAKRGEEFKKHLRSDSLAKRTK